jgi:hypothetical protein
MPLRAASILLAVLALIAAVSPAGAGTQSQPGNLEDLWEHYPLKAPSDQQPVGKRAEDGSPQRPPPAAVPPPRAPAPAERGGLFPLALLVLAQALVLVGVVVGVHQWIRWLRRRKRERPGRLGERAGNLGR